MISHHRQDLLQVAARYQLNPQLLEAQVFVESSDDPFALRYEPLFWTTYLRAKPQWASSGPLAACSYGLLQVLYATAVDDGYHGRPEGLFVPVVGLLAGALHFRTLLDRLSGNEAAALAAYNGGLSGNQVPPYRNANYVTKVLAIRDRLSP